MAAQNVMRTCEGKLNKFSLDDDVDVNNCLAQIKSIDTYHALTNHGQTCVQYCSTRWMDQAEITKDT